jgi:hypothetical protein
MLDDSQVIKTMNRIEMVYQNLQGTMKDKRSVDGKKTRHGGRSGGSIVIFTM